MNSCSYAPLARKGLTKFGPNSAAFLGQAISGPALTWAIHSRDGAEPSPRSWNEEPGTQPRILWRVFDIMNDQHKFPRALALQGPAGEKKQRKNEKSSGKTQPDN